MSTPSMALLKIFKLVSVGVALIWAFITLVSVFYNFHIAYSSHVAKKNDERWLLKKCSDPDFFINMKQHTDLCESVSKNAQSNAILFALNHVVSNTYICGNRACFDIIAEIVSRLGWQALLLIGIVALVVAHTAISLLRTYLYTRIGVRHPKNFFQNYGPQRYPVFDIEDDYDHHELWDGALRKRRPNGQLAIAEGV